MSSLKSQFIFEVGFVFNEIKLTDILREYYGDEFSFITNIKISMSLPYSPYINPNKVDLIENTYDNIMKEYVYKFICDNLCTTIRYTSIYNIEVLITMMNIKELYIKFLIMYYIQTAMRQEKDLKETNDIIMRLKILQTSQWTNL